MQHRKVALFALAGFVAVAALAFLSGAPERLLASDQAAATDSESPPPQPELDFSDVPAYLAKKEELKAAIEEGAIPPPLCEWSEDSLASMMWLTVVEPDEQHRTAALSPTHRDLYLEDEFKTPRAICVWFSSCVVNGERFVLTDPLDGRPVVACSAKERYVAEADAK